MKFYKLIIIIVIVFLKTGNVLSNNNVFDVNNIEIEKNGKINNKELANKAIKKGFIQLIEKILLQEDYRKLKELKFTEIKELVTYYQISNKNKNFNKKEIINFNISFDKNKIHNLFYKLNISYTEISNKELFILPILKKDSQIFIYNQNFFYNKWNEIHDTELIEFILPLESIEVVQNINLNRNNLLNLQLSNLFAEYPKTNLALVLIEDNNADKEKIYLKVQILGKKIVKNIIIERDKLKEEEFYKKITKIVKQEIINLVKSENLIDISTPSFLNVKFNITKKNNLIELNSRLKKIDLIEKTYVQEFNNESVYLKIKYLGKLDKIIKRLENQKIILKSIGDQWSIKII